MWWRTLLAVLGILPAGATLYFWIFWSHFDYWRRRRLQIYSVLGAISASLAAASLIFRRAILAGRIDMPIGVQVAGWVLIGIITVFGTVADRQLGIRLRVFTPFFKKEGHIDLITTGAYGVVRHPIYACASFLQLGIFLVTGYPAVLVAWAIFTLGALWFTKQEEMRLAQLLDDPSEYDRYRERVPAMFPMPRRSSA